MDHTSNRNRNRFKNKPVHSTGHPAKPLSLPVPTSNGPTSPLHVVDLNSPSSRQLRTAHRLNAAQQALKTKFTSLTRGKAGKKWVAPSAKDVQDMAQWVQKQKMYWIDTFANDPEFREQILIMVRDQQALQDNLLKGELSVEERLEKGRKISQRGMKAFRLANAQGWTADSDWATTVGGATYASSSVRASYILFTPSILRIALLLGAQIAQAYTDPQESQVPIQKVQWAVNGTYVLATLYFTLYAMAYNGCNQSTNVGLQTLEQHYFSLDISSNKCSIIGPDGKPMDLKLRSLRSAQNDLDWVQDCVIAYNKGSHSALAAQCRRLKQELKKHQASIKKQSLAIRDELRRQRKSEIALTPEENKLADGGMMHVERLEAVLKLQNTPNAPDATQTKAISKALSQAMFYQTLYNLLSTSATDMLSEVSVDASDDRLLPVTGSIEAVSVVSEDSSDSAEEPPPPDADATAKPNGPVPISVRVPEVLRDQYVFLQQEVTTLTAMRQINIQKNLGHSRFFRVVNQDITTWLSWIPNLTATLWATSKSMTVTALTVATTASALTYGFGMDFALMAMLVLTPFIYSRTHPYFAKADLEHKIIAQGVAFAFTSGACFLGADGKVDPKLVAGAMKSIVDAVLGHVATILDADARIYTQDLLAYATDASTRDERRAAKAKVRVAGKNAKVACTYRALSTAFRQCKTAQDRQLFVESLADSRQVSEAVRASMLTTLGFYELNLQNIDHAKKANVVELIGPTSTLPVESRQIIYQCLLFAQVRFAAYQTQDESIRDTALYKELHEWSRVMAYLKGLVESGSLMGDLQVIQKGAGYLLGVGMLGTAAPMLIKAVVVAAVVVLDNVGVPLHISTKVKLVGNSLTLLTLFVSAFAAYVTYVLIGNKNGWRNFISAEGNVFHTGLLSEYPGLFSLSRMFGLVVQHQPLMATPIQERSESGVSAHLFGQFMNFLSRCHDGAQAAEQEATEAESKDKVPTPSTVIDVPVIEDDSDESAAQEPSSESQSSESSADDEVEPERQPSSGSSNSSDAVEHEDLTSVEPIPAMPFAKPFSDASLMWSAMNAPTVKEIFTSFLAKYEKLDPKQLDKVASKDLEQLKAMFLPQQVTDDSSSSSSDDSSDDDAGAGAASIPPQVPHSTPHAPGSTKAKTKADGKPDARPATTPWVKARNLPGDHTVEDQTDRAIEDLKGVSLWSEKKLSKAKRSRRVDKLFNRIVDSRKIESQRERWHRVQQQLRRALEKDQRLEKKSGHTDTVRQSLAMLRTLVERLDAMIERDRLDEGIEDAVVIPEDVFGAPEAPAMDLNSVIPELREVGLWADPSLSDGQQIRRVDEYASAILGQGDATTEHRHWSRVLNVLRSADIDADLVESVARSIALLQHLLAQLQPAMDVQDKKKQKRDRDATQTTTRIPSQVRTEEQAAMTDAIDEVYALRATLREHKLWSRDPNESNDQLRQRGQRYADALMFQPDFKLKETNDWFSALIKKMGDASALNMDDEHADAFARSSVSLLAARDRLRALGTGDAPRSGMPVAPSTQIPIRAGQAQQAIDPTGQAPASLSEAERGYSEAELRTARSRALRANFLSGIELNQKQRAQSIGQYLNSVLNDPTVDTDALRQQWNATRQVLDAASKNPPANADRNDPEAFKQAVSLIDTMLNELAHAVVAARFQPPAALSAPPTRSSQPAAQRPAPAAKRPAAQAFSALILPQEMRTKLENAGFLTQVLSGDQTDEQYRGIVLRQVAAIQRDIQQSNGRASAQSVYNDWVKVRTSLRELILSKAHDASPEELAKLRQAVSMINALLDQDLFKRVKRREEDVLLV